MTGTNETELPQLIVYCGPMYSGKSTALYNVWNYNKVAKKTIQVIKPIIDNRYSSDSIITHSKKEIDKEYVACLSLDLPKEEWKNINFGAEIFLIDEIQFFNIEIIDLIKRLLNTGKTIHVAGLDLDSKGNPFGQMPSILSLATSVQKIEGTCKKCGCQKASRTFRKNEIKNDSQILIGGEDIYESRCFNCWKL